MKRARYVYFLPIPHCAGQYIQIFHLKKRYFWVWKVQMASRNQMQQIWWVQRMYILYVIWQNFKKLPKRKLSGTTNLTKSLNPMFPHENFLFNYFISLPRVCPNSLKMVSIGALYILKDIELEAKALETSTCKRTFIGHFNFQPQGKNYWSWDGHPAPIWQASTKLHRSAQLSWLLGLQTNGLAQFWLKCIQWIQYSELLGKVVPIYLHHSQQNFWHCTPSWINALSMPCWFIALFRELCALDMNKNCTYAYKSAILFWRLNKYSFLIDFILSGNKTQFSLANVIAEGAWGYILGSFMQPFSDPPHAELQYSKVGIKPS